MTLKLNGTNSVAAPAYAGDDADTGLQCGTNELKLVTGGTARFTVESDGDVTVEAGDCNLTDGNLVVAAGHGIDFSADANASGMTSELLDDYEEGTWTPTISGSITAGTYTPNASGANGGYYVKVGRKVTAWFNALGTVANATGDVRVSGLPFAVPAGNTPAGTGNTLYSIGSVQYWSGPVGLCIGPLGLPSTTSMFFHTYDTAGSGSTGGGQPTITNVTHNLHAFVTYFVA